MKDHRTGILGAGFGLYGYLPAIGNMGGSIVLPERYRQKFSARPELLEYERIISWVPDEASIYDRVDCLIVCKNPETQPEVAFRALKYSNIRYLLLEKPLAANPLLSLEMLKELILSDLRFRIGFNFQYTDWGKDLLEVFQKNDGSAKETDIIWNFNAHHYRHNLNNWKRYNTNGGGVIRFYGIHLIALLVQMGSCEVIKSDSDGLSNDDIYRWNARIAINKISFVNIAVNAKSTDNLFSVKTDEILNAVRVSKIHNILADPFSEKYSMAQGGDRRIKYLQPVISDLFHGQPQAFLNEIYLASNKLWEEIENSNVVRVR